MHLPYKAFLPGHPEMQWHIYSTKCFLFLNPLIPEFSDSYKILKMHVRPRSSNAYKNAPHNSQSHNSQSSGTYPLAYY